MEIEKKVFTVSTEAWRVYRPLRDIRVIRSRPILLQGGESLLVIPYAIEFLFRRWLYKGSSEELTKVKSVLESFHPATIKATTWDDDTELRIEL